MCRRRGGGCRPRATGWRRPKSRPQISHCSNPKWLRTKRCNPDRDLVPRGLPILKFTHVAKKRVLSMLHAKQCCMQSNAACNAESIVLYMGIPVYGSASHVCEVYPHIWVCPRSWGKPPHRGTVHTHMGVYLDMGVYPHMGVNPQYGGIPTIWGCTPIWGWVYVYLHVGIYTS